MNRRHLLLGAVLLLAAALVYFDGGAPSGVAEAVPRRPPPRTASAPVAPVAPVQGALLALAPRAELFGAQGADALFGSRDFTPPPAPPPAAKPAAPVAPPVPFSYLGKMLGEGRWEVYLARAGQSYVVREGAAIDNTYRVERIAPPVLTLTYLPLNQVQQLNIGSD